MTERLQLCEVALEDRLIDVMWALDRGGVGIALVCDADGHLVGTMTDGDVRRALLREATIDSPIAPFVQRGFTAVGPRVSRAEVIDLMQARTIQQIPIVDDERRLLGMHLLHEVLGAVERPNWAVVMAGGRGTRLAPLTDNIPKPMLRVAGRPILERIVLHLVSFGFRRVFLAVNYLGHLVEAHFGDGSHFGCAIDYLREDEPVGTAGALALLPERPTIPLLVMNGDILTQADLGSLLRSHAADSAMATVGVKRYVHTVPFGRVETAGGRITRMQEKPRLEVSINAGIYVIDPALPARVSPGQSLDMPSLLARCLERGEVVRAFEIEDDWIDIGRREELERASGEGA